MKEWLNLLNKEKDYFQQIKNLKSSFSFYIKY